MSAPLVLGSRGQVGRALLSEYPGATAWDQGEIDLSKPDEAARRVLELGPSAVLNAAAYTAVDRAESEPELARQVNAIAPGKLAGACKELGIPFVHYSTDYVFSGEGERPWTEEDPTGPLNVYGKTKLEGERAVEKTGGHYLILRTSWIYAPEGQNFVRTMLKLGAEKDVLMIVNDQFGSPTYAPELVRATVEALKAAQASVDFPSGIYHVCSDGVTTWHALALAIFERARKAGLPLKVKDVIGIPSRDYSTPAKRPSNSRLSTAKIQSKLGVHMPHWSQSLDDCFRRIAR